MLKYVKIKKKIIILLLLLVLLGGGMVLRSNSTLADCTSVCLDFDGDGYGNPASSNCDVSGDLDCDDTNPLIWNSSPEGPLYTNCDDGDDNDCDGLVDCNDNDCDTAGNCIASCSITCSAPKKCFAVDPGDTVIAIGDCCDITQSCYDCAPGFTWSGGACVSNCIDSDGDRYAEGNVDFAICSNCGDGTQTCLGNMDCDDTDKHVYPGNLETCDLKNNDCAGGIDDGCDDDNDDFCDDSMDIWDNSMCPNTVVTPGYPGDDCDDTSAAGGSFNINESEMCDVADHDCDGDNYNGIDREACKLACEADSFMWTGNGLPFLQCCGNDPDEGGFGTNIFQSGNETLCNDLVDNDCSGTCDLVAGACYGGTSLADSDCTGTCNLTGENDWTNAATPGNCNQCSFEGDQDIGDAQDGEDWTAYPGMVDKCDNDCGTVSNTVSIVDYQDANEFSPIDKCNDGLDNDCDGLLDCADSDCVASPSCGACVPTADPTEICDGVDNDCVGGIDNGLTGALTSDQDGVCSGALKTCSGAGGWVDDYSSIANYEAVETLCDTLDNDCDGVMDVGCPACTPTADPTEICDGVDNDCVGGIDNGLTGALTSDQDGVCSGALKTCSGAGGWVDDYSSIANYEAVETLCDTLDNDCDGAMDAGCVFCTFPFIFPCVFP